MESIPGGNYIYHTNFSVKIFVTKYHIKCIVKYILHSESSAINLKL